MFLILPGFVLATLAVLFWSILAPRKQPAELIPGRVSLAVGVAALLGAAATLWLVFAPTYEGLSESRTAGTPSSGPVSSAGSLIDANGIWVLIPLLVPIALLLAPLIGRRATARRAITITSALLLTVFVVVAGFSIGLFFLPAALVLWVAVPAASSPARSA